MVSVIAASTIPYKETSFSLFFIYFLFILYRHRHRQQQEQQQQPTVLTLGTHPPGVVLTIQVNSVDLLVGSSGFGLKRIPPGPLVPRTNSFRTG